MADSEESVAASNRTAVVKSLKDVLRLYDEGMLTADEVELHALLRLLEPHLRSERSVQIVSSSGLSGAPMMAILTLHPGSSVTITPFPDRSKSRSPSRAAYQKALRERATSVICSYCKAAPGSPCTGAYGQPVVYTHPARRRDAASKARHARASQVSRAQRAHGDNEMRLHGWRQDDEDPSVWTYGGRYFAAAMWVTANGPTPPMKAGVRIWPILGEVGTPDPTVPLGPEHAGMYFASEAEARAYVESWERAFTQGEADARAYWR